MRAGQNRGAGQSTDYGYPNTYGRRLTPRPLFMPIVRIGFSGRVYFRIYRSTAPCRNPHHLFPLIRFYGPCPASAGGVRRAASRPVVPTSRRCGFYSLIRFRAGRRRFRSVARLRKLGFRIPCFRGSIRIQIGVCPAFRVSYSGNGSKSSNKVRPCAPRVAIARSVQTP